MDEDRKNRLSHYFLNARTFLWSIGRQRNQAETYSWLFGKHFSQENGYAYRQSYDSVAKDMLERYGIEKIVDLVKDEARNYFGSSIENLRKYWDAGSTPTLKDIKREKIENYAMKTNPRDDYRKEFTISGPSFLDVNVQYEYVEGWTTWAHIYFEEIEPANQRKPGIHGEG